MDTFRIRRSSISRFGSMAKQEPLIVVDESQIVEEDDQESSETPSNKASLDIDSPVNPYLLSPWRDPRESRKHSLPSQQVTEGITASQVRRLSERGGEGSGPSPKEAAFLATLSQAPAPSGRRHSVVTISKVPTTIFGRARRESVAALPNNRLIGSRRESNTSTGPPSTDPIGSIHNLQLDIMDDIVQSRKARMKLWTTSSEKVCEVETLNEVGGTTPQRYTNRRYSESVSAQPTPSPTPSYRRPSEHPAVMSPCITQPTSNRSSTRRKKSTGFLGGRTDIGSIFSNLTSSAIEIHKCEDKPTPPPSSSATKTKTTLQAPSHSSSNLLDPNAGRSTRSNSFDVSILNNAKQLVSDAQDNSSAALSGWFANRHEPMARKKSIRSKSTAMALSKDVLEKLQAKDVLRESKPKLVPRSKQKSWTDHTKGTIVDATVIGSAIEGFLRKNSASGPSGGSGSSAAATSSSSSKTSKSGAVPKDNGSSRRSRTQAQAANAVRSTLNWFGKGDEDDTKDTCDASLCSTLKDLFVK
ncbi:kairos [Musca autumnalis]|uniref:kairos n=1 Tax=Musca autumnalis TaxID=221902 RepID=UPI003CECB1BB